MGRLQIPLLRWLNQNYISIIIIGLPVLLYLYNSLPLWPWLIDDAGISFVYSRNLAAGHGLVYQPGVEPVEGYSNFLWVLVMALFFLLGLFDPFITSKTVSIVLVVVSFILIHRIVGHMTPRKYLASFIVLCSISLNAPFVIWTSSGLENPLYSTLIISLLYVIVVKSRCRPFSYGSILLISLLAWGVALTRPDGIVYLALFGLIQLFALISRETGLRTFSKQFSVYAISSVILCGSFVLFRLLYFGEIYPNTYFVKGGPDIDAALSAMTLNGAYLVKYRDLLTSVVGSHLWLLSTIILMVFLGVIIIEKEKQTMRLALLLFTLTAGFVFLVLPIDWMGEYRFATPFFPLFYCTVVVSCTIVLDRTIATAPIRAVVGVCLAAFLIVTNVKVYHKRLNEYQEHPRVDFASLGKKYGDSFNNYADYLNIEGASLLLPDIGAAMYYSKLRIYDLGGLCDKTIAKSRGKDQQRFYDYIFDEMKPTFIHTHGYFTAVSKFDDDSRFLNEYTPLYMYQDGYVESKYKAQRISGDFVRKEAVTGKESQLDSLRNGLIK